MPRPGVALTAPAKINLALHVTGRRADRFHLLDSLVVFADFGDRVEIAPAEQLGLTCTGPFASHAPGDHSDLAWRAAEALFAHTGRAPAAAIKVEKAIPAGAGLGGGSADAAAVLLALNDFLEAGARPETLRAIGLALGADVPMCLVGKALRARGVGEEIVPVAHWPALPLVLVWPGVTVSTAEVFSSLASRENPPLAALPDASAAGSAEAVAAWLARCRNDLQAPALRVAPEIGAVLDALNGTEGCLLARMSGSGSACFGLYADRAAAERAAARIAETRPQWWVKAAEAR